MSPFQRPGGPWYQLHRNSGKFLTCGVVENVRQRSLRWLVYMSVYPVDEPLPGIFQVERARPTLQERVGRLFEEARDDVYRYLLTLGLHPPRAQEAVQEVFLRLYATLRKGE